MSSKGYITLPVEQGMDDLLKDIAEKWGADAVRNSDGTELPANIGELGLEVYSTLSLTRADQDWAREHEDELTQKFLMSDPVTAFDTTVEINIMKGWFDQQFRPDARESSRKWYDVYDRTTGEKVDPENWTYDPETTTVTIHNAVKYHVYTVNFLAYQIWDTTSMYNYVTNNWTGEHIRPMDPNQPKTREHLKEFLNDWLDKNPQTDVVRFTSLAYHFTNNFQDINGEIRSRYRDWLGYHDCTSALALEQFEKEYGYALTSEDIIREGYLSDVNSIPTKKYRDWMDFIQRTVAGIAKEWVDIAHEKGRKTMMFYCDHHIGSEPYGKYFPSIGLDSIVNPCMSGVELRRVADIPGDIVKEVRLYPYFFPVNLEGKPNFPDGDPVGDCKKYWKNIRRAMVQNPADRIGFGGYLSLAVTRPDFIDYVGVLAEEFRTIRDTAKKYDKYKAPFKVGILNCWGKIRSWIDDDINDWTKPYRGGVLECLSGMNVDLEYMSFDDVLENGIPSDVKVIINMGDAYTAWSGGEYWKNEKLTEILRDFVYAQGGGLIGVGDPTAYQHQGHFFQLFDVLGVDKELGFGKSAAKLPFTPVESHFLLEDGVVTEELKHKKDRVFISSLATDVILADDDNVLIAANSYGKGRGLYLTDLKYSDENVRLLQRALFWAANKEDEMKKWYSENVYVECTAFPEAGKFIVLNNSYEAQTTVIYNGEGKKAEITLEPFMSKWMDMDELFN